MWRFAPKHCSMFETLDPITLVLLSLIGFVSGFLDSIVGGGGLIGTPAIMNLFPGWQILQVIGTNRTSSIIGTSVAAFHYFRKVRIALPLVISACCAALVCSYLGVSLAKTIPSDTLKWVVLCVIIILALYSIVKKDLGQTDERRYSGRVEWLAAAAIGAACGFYNGLIGPGTGTLLVFGFVSVLGMDFLKGSAIAKATNVAGDISSWVVLLTSGYVVLAAAIPLVFGNVIGSSLGSRLAIAKGSAFIRWVFIVMVFGLILRLLSQI
jgi:uncharacterized protein